MVLVKITKDGDELTRHGFISEIESYIKQLLIDPKKASISKYLMSHGVENEGILSALLDNTKENGAILTRKESIKTNPDTGKDMFFVKYSYPREGAYRKLRNLYADLFENYQTGYNLLNEEDGGATSADASGQFSQPVFPMMRRTIYMTESQVEKLKGLLNEDGVESTGFGGGFEFGYDAPASIVDRNDPTLKRHNGKGGSISVNRL